MVRCVGTGPCGVPKCTNEATVLLCWSGGLYENTSEKVPFCAECVDGHEALWRGYAIREELDAPSWSEYRVWREAL